MKLKKVAGIILAGTIMTSNIVTFAEYDPSKVIQGPITTLSVEVPQQLDNTDENVNFIIEANGQIINQTGTKVYINEDGVEMLPLRVIGEALGYKVKWNGEQKSVELIKGAHWVMLKLDEDYYCFGKMAPMQLGHLPKIVASTTYVPVNFFTDVLRAEVSRNKEKGIKISTNKPSIDEESLLAIKGEIQKINKTEKTTMVWIKGKNVDQGFETSIILNINENTKLVNAVTDKQLAIEDLKEGDIIRGFYGPAVTKSLPPQAYAKKIEILKPDNIKQ